MAAKRDKNGRFIKGGVPNPKGRPPKAREERYTEILKQSVTYKQFEKIIRKVADKAERGDLKAAELLIKYFVGQPTQKLEHTGAEGAPMAVTLVEVVRSGE